MDFWAIASGAVGLVGLLVARVIQPHLAGKAMPRTPTGGDRHRLDLAIMTVVAFILLGIAVPSFQHFRDRPLIDAQLAGLPEASRDPAAQEHLRAANARLLRASKLAAQDDLTVADRSSYLASIQEASSELLAAKELDPSLADSARYKDVALELQRLEERARRSVNLTAVGPRPVSGWKANSDIWLLATIVVAGVFLLCVVGIVILVAVLHGGGKPETAKRWLRTYLEPIAAGCAMLIGVLIALNPGLEHETALWGAAVAGGGFGFWIKQ